MKNESCNLPLLDGKTSSDHPISAEVEVQHVERVLHACQIDRANLKRIVCAAWALLLRCYTGQHQVAFFFQSSDDSAGSVEVYDRKDQPDTLQVTLDEGENLSQVIQATAKIIEALRESKRSTFQPESVNTGVEFLSFRSTSAGQQINAKKVSVARFAIE